MTSGLQVSLDVKDHACLVIGGGPEAAGKAKRLLDAGAQVTVISPVLTEELQRLVTAGAIRHRARRFKVSDAGAKVRLVMNTVRTDEALSRRLFRLARRQRFLLCATDQPQYSNFTMPALVARGPLRIAISTSGVSPALARRLRQDLEPVFDARFARFLRRLEADRADLKKTEPQAEKRQAQFRQAVAQVKLHARLEFPEMTSDREKGA